MSKIDEIMRSLQGSRPPEQENNEDARRPVANGRDKILAEAKLTLQDRGQHYGGVERNFGRIARNWSAHLTNRYDLDINLDAMDVAMMMQLLKMGRLQGNPTHHDSWVDNVGYGACGGEIAMLEGSDAP